MEIRIYHNPDCEISRNALALIRNNGAELQIIEYLKDSPSRVEIWEMRCKRRADRTGSTPVKGRLFAELGLDNASLSDEELLDHNACSPYSY